MFIFSTLFLLIIVKGYEFAPDVSVDCPGRFIDSNVMNVTGSLNSSVLTTGITGNCVFDVTSVNFYLIRGINESELLCTQNFSTSTSVCDQNFNAKGCRCDRIAGNIFYYTYQFTAKFIQDGGVIQMRPNCYNASGKYPLVESVCNITLEAITTTTTNSFNTTTSPPCGNSTKYCNQSDKCPVWSIVVAVCVPCVGSGIMITTAIIIKKKKAKMPGSSCCLIEWEKFANLPDVCPSKASPSNYTPPINTPEKEKRRKKKKKKKTFQEVGGESVSREEKSIQKAARKSQNDNSVSVNENSHSIDNRMLRRFPMSKT